MNLSTIKYLFLCSFLCFPLLHSKAETTQEDSNNSSTTNYRPVVGGLIRSKYEMKTYDATNRFQVRNARIKISGKLNKKVAYKLQYDFCEKGKMGFKDAYIKYHINTNWSTKIGIQKVPFSTENLRSPSDYYFANRSFIAKQMSHDVRQVGMSINYQNNTVKLPFSATLGVYNNNGVVNQEVWQKEMNFAGRLEIKPIKTLSISLSMNSVIPYAHRMNLYNCNISKTFGKWHLETEYIFKTYEKEIFNDTHAFLIFGSYDIETPSVDWLNKISPVVRFDWMDNNSLLESTNNTFSIKDFERHRYTAGINFSLGEPFYADIRLNYEHYNSKDLSTNQEDKIVIECVVKF